MCRVRRIHVYSYRYFVCLGTFRLLQRDVRFVTVDEQEPALPPVTFHPCLFGQCLCRRAPSKSGIDVDKSDERARNSNHTNITWPFYLQYARA